MSSEWEFGQHAVAKDAYAFDKDALSCFSNILNTSTSQAKNNVVTSLRKRQHEGLVKE